MTTQERAERTFEVYRKARDEKGYTDYKVAHMASIRASCICDWKHGRYTPKVDKLIVIANVLEIQPTAFFEVM